MEWSAPRFRAQNNKNMVAKDTMKEDADGKSILW